MNNNNPYGFAESYKYVSRDTPTALGTTLVEEIALRAPTDCDVQKCLELISRGADLNTHHHGHSLLDMAMEKGHDAIVLAMVEKSKKSAPLFIRLSATVLHMAILNNRQELTAELIKRGEALNAPDSAAHTPLHWACLWDRTECARLLINAGAATDLKNNEGRTAQDYARVNKQSAITPMLMAAAEKTETTEPVKIEPVQQGKKLALMKKIKLKPHKPQ